MLLVTSHGGNLIVYCQVFSLLLFSSRRGFFLVFHKNEVLNGSKLKLGLMLFCSFLLATSHSGKSQCQACNPLPFFIRTFLLFWRFGAPILCLRQKHRFYDLCVLCSNHGTFLNNFHLSFADVQRHHAVSPRDKEATVGPEGAEQRSGQPEEQKTLGSKEGKVLLTWMGANTCCLFVFLATPNSERALLLHPRREKRKTFPFRSNAHTSRIYFFVFCVSIFSFDFDTGRCPAGIRFIFFPSAQKRRPETSCLVKDHWLDTWFLRERPTFFFFSLGSGYAFLFCLFCSHDVTWSVLFF